MRAPLVVRTTMRGGGLFDLLWIFFFGGVLDRVDFTFVAPEISNWPALFQTSWGNLRLSAGFGSYPVEFFFEGTPLTLLIIIKHFSFMRD